MASVLAFNPGSKPGADVKPNGVSVESETAVAFTVTPTMKAGFQIRVYGLQVDGVAIPHTPTPTVVPTVAPTVQPQVLSIPDLICSYSWPCGEALSVAHCESRYRPEAYNPVSGASGVFQVVPYWHSWRLRPGESLFDASVNVRIAYELWSESGWRPWECAPVVR